MQQDMNRYAPKHPINDEKLFSKAKEYVEKNRFEDDITVVWLEKIGRLAVFYDPTTAKEFLVVIKDSGLSGRNTKNPLF